MKVTSSFVRLISGIIIAALLTMMYASVTPAAAGYAGSTAALQDICSAAASVAQEGVRNRDQGVDSWQQPQHDRHDQHAGHLHCAFCCKHNSACLAALPVGLVQLPGAFRVVVVSREHPSPILASAWLRLPPRGPPTVRS